MTLYHDTEKERTLSDRVNLPYLEPLALPDLYELQQNIEQTLETAWCYHSELLTMALQMDLQKVDLYIRMKEKQQK